MILSVLRGLIGLALAVALLPINGQAQTVVFPDVASGSGQRKNPARTATIRVMRAVLSLRMAAP